MIKLNLCKIDSYQKIKAMYAPVRLSALHGMCCELKVTIRDVRNQQKILVFFFFVLQKLDCVPLRNRGKKERN